MIAVRPVNPQPLDCKSDALTVTPPVTLRSDIGSGYGSDVVVVVRVDIVVVVVVVTKDYLVCGVGE